MSNMFVSRAMGAFAVVGVLACAGAANASVMTMNVADDAAFNALGLTTLFEAQGRIGNAATNGTQEADLGPTTSAPVDQAQFAWVTNQPVSFTLTYDTATNLVSWTIFGETMEYTAADDATQLAIRMRATTQRDNISVTLAEMMLDGHAIPSVSAANPGDGVEYLVIKGAEVANGFTLTGRANLIFDQGNPPTNSNLAFQIKGVVPAPGAAALAAMGLLAGTRRRR